MPGRDGHCVALCPLPPQFWHVTLFCVDFLPGALLEFVHLSASLPFRPLSTRAGGKTFADEPPVPPGVGNFTLPPFSAELPLKVVPLRHLPDSVPVAS